LLDFEMLFYAWIILLCYETLLALPVGGYSVLMFLTPPTYVACYPGTNPIKFEPELRRPPTLFALIPCWIVYI